MNDQTQEKIDKIREDIASALLQFVFEPNTPETWSKVTAAINAVLDQHEVAERVVVCDGKINDSNSKLLQAEVAVKLQGHIEFVYLPVRMSPPTFQD